MELGLEFVGRPCRENSWARENDTTMNESISFYIGKSRIIRTRIIDNVKTCTRISFDKAFICNTLEIDGTIKIVSIHRLQDIIKPLIKTVAKAYRYDKIAEFIKEYIF